MTPFAAIAPAFVEMAHRIVWCTGATVDVNGRPRSRVLHPIWNWDGEQLTGWIATSPSSPKADDLRSTPLISLTYWTASQDTCTADCDIAWELSPEERAAGWARFADTPPPIGYDPALIPGWDSPDAPAFGVLRVEPYRLRVMDGSLMGGGSGRLLTWHQ